MARRARVRREPLSRPCLPTGCATARRHRHVRAGLDVQGRDRRGGARGGHRRTRRRRSTCPYEIEVADRVIHDAGAAATETMTVSADPLALVERRRRHARAAARQDAARRVDRAVRLRSADRASTFRARAAGIVLPAEQWTGSTIGNVPIGQGIAVTPLQMAAVYAAIANGGVLAAAAPRGARRRARRSRAGSERRIVSERTASRALDDDGKVVVSEGTGTRRRSPATPSPARPARPPSRTPTGGYSDTRYVASFVGFVPARAPAVRRPRRGGRAEDEICGGVVAAPAFAEIAEFALQYLDVPPDAPAEPKSRPSTRPGPPRPHPLSAYRRVDAR